VISGGAANREGKTWTSSLPPNDSPARSALELRAWCIDLGVRAAHAAVVVGSGGANLLDSSAQRLFREAMLYTLTAQTWPLQQASLRRLLARESS
jgi:hypothetical protein